MEKSNQFGIWHLKTVNSLLVPPSTNPGNLKIKVSLRIHYREFPRREKTPFHSEQWLEREGLLPRPLLYLTASVCGDAITSVIARRLDCFHNEAYDEKNILKQCTHCDFM